jgi:hypothetical protein
MVRAVRRWAEPARRPVVACAARMEELPKLCHTPKLFACTRAARETQGLGERGSPSTQRLGAKSYGLND